VTIITVTLLADQYTGLFISPSGISDPCGTIAGMVTPKGSMSTEGLMNNPVQFGSYLAQFLLEYLRKKS
jgi:hypothetical protein